jgi:carbamoyl-phosphate synthase small subunit
LNPYQEAPLGSIVPPRATGARTITAKLALEDGSVYRGQSIGAEGESVGEVVFNTSLSGYQEIFTDPSYKGQMVVMTNPLIGNYGINPEDEESLQPHPRGVIVRELSRRPSSFRASADLGSYLKKSGIVGISGVDTRAITRRLRVEGSLKGIIATGSADDPGMESGGLAEDALVEKAKAWPGLGGIDMVAEVTCRSAYVWDEGLDTPFASCFKANRPRERLGQGFRVAAFDYGIKHNILRILRDLGFEVHVLPAGTTADEVRALRPDGIFLSNGPGDPAGLPYAAKTIRALLEDYPIFGICLGHQLVSHALGGTTYKLKFGHHGGNHPVKNLLNGKVEISVQNHCYAVDPASLPREVKPYFLNLNDQSLEGLVHTELPIFAVQFHPEASPGPNDFTFLFDQFAKMLKEQKPLAAAGK